MPLPDGREYGVVDFLWDFSLRTGPTVVLGGDDTSKLSVLIRNCIGELVLDISDSGDVTSESDGVLDC